MKIKQLGSIAFIFGVTLFVFNTSPVFAQCSQQQSEKYPVPCCCQVGADSYIQYYISTNGSMETCNQCDGGDCVLNQQCPYTSKEKK